jgi:Protein of unknown function (DUF3108)
MISFVHPIAVAVACLVCAFGAAAQVQMASVGPSTLSRILPPPSAYRFPSGEKLTYSVQWHMLNAGTTTILMQRAGSAEHLTSTADSAGLVNRIFRIHDTFDADVDARTFCTQQISKHNEEGSRRMDRRIYFDYPHAKSQVDDKDLKTGKQKHAEFDIPPCVSDVVSGFFYARSLPLQIGFSQVFPVNDGGKTTDVRIKVESRERVKGPVGEFQTLRVKAEAIAGPMAGKAELLVWLTDDERRVPVQMKSKLGFATLLFQLQKIEPPTDGH